jgi:hypothetical protein
LHRFIALICFLLQQQPCSTTCRPAFQELHALAAFDVMVGIVDLLESDHGWSTEQSQAWLDRMGHWEGGL